MGYGNLAHAESNISHETKLSGIYETIDCSRMDGKRGHVTCGNRLAIEREESFQKFASLEEELLLCSGLLGPYKFRMA